MTKCIEAERAGAALLWYALVYPNTKGRNKDRAPRSDPTHAGLLAAVD